MKIPPAYLYMTLKEDIKVKHYGSRSDMNKMYISCKSHWQSCANLLVTFNNTFYVFIDLFQHVPVEEDIKIISNTLVVVAS
jgi:hypothetical protein